MSRVPVGVLPQLALGFVVGSLPPFLLQILSERMLQLVYLVGGVVV